MIDSILDVINLWSKCEKHVAEFRLTHTEHVEYLMIVIWHMKFFSQDPDISRWLIELPYWFKARIFFPFLGIFFYVIRNI